MSPYKAILFLATMTFTCNAGAQEVSALSCKDFRPTQAAIERYPSLLGSCEAIVERDGELFGKFAVIVRRVRGNELTLHLPATGHTFKTRVDSSLRVLADGRKARPSDISPGQRVHIYLSTQEFATPDIDVVSFVTESNFIVGVEVENVDPTATSASPGRVAAATVRSAVIVEAIDKETRELKVIDAHGRRFSVVAGEAVINFDQIEPRDRIITEYLESVAIVVLPLDAPAAGSGTAIEIAPIDGKPGIIGVETYIVTATVESLNVDDRIVTLRNEYGAVSTAKLADDVPLDLIEVGAEVRLRVTTAIAVSVRKADKT